MPTSAATAPSPGITKVPLRTTRSNGAVPSQRAGLIRLCLDVLFHGPDAVRVEIRSPVRIDEGADLVARLRRLLQYGESEQIRHHSIGGMVEQHGVLGIGIDGKP